jgi:formylglycine-generating enzyme required for sulfatase activity
VTFYADVDNDGDGDLYTSDIIQACYQYESISQQYVPPVGYSDIQGDCDDNSVSISSLEPELCTPIDENCDGSATVGAIDQVQWFVDSDGDTFGNPAFSIVSCPTNDPQTNLEVPPLGYSNNSDDCDDLDGELFPGNVEICNGKLDDCDAAEDADGDGVVEYTARTIEIDHDSDGFIECFFNTNEWTDLNTLPIGPILGSSASIDCQPLDDDVFPGAPELCTGEVEDCDSPDYGTTPDDESDDDGDGYVECTGFIGIGWEGDPNVSGGDDCDDRSTDDNGDGDPDGFYTYPGAAENYPDPLNPDLNFCVADQDQDGLPDCARMTTNLQQESPNGYFCEYGIFLDTTTLGAIGPDFVYIPAGQDPDGRYELTQPFYMMTTEVTREMYEALTGEQPSNYQSNLPGNDYPVEYIQWIDAARFANLLSEEVGLDICYNESNNYAPYNQYSGSDFYLCPGYRLPTEAEWEYAARAGVSLPYLYLGAGVWTPDGGGYIQGYGANSYIDDNVNSPSFSSYAWWHYNNSPNGPKQVSRLEPNGFGLYDLHGNVQEMVNDWSISTSPGNFSGHVFPNNGTLNNGVLIDPIGPGSGTIKVLRGGSYRTHNQYQIGFGDSASTGVGSGSVGWDKEYIDTGFRLVRTDL